MLRSAKNSAAFFRGNQFFKPVAIQRSETFFAGTARASGGSWRLAGETGKRGERGVMETLLAGALEDGGWPGMRVGGWPAQAPGFLRRQGQGNGKKTPLRASLMEAIPRRLGMRLPAP